MYCIQQVGLPTLVVLLGYALTTCSTAPVRSRTQVLLSDDIHSAEHIRHALKEASIIPSILDDFTPSLSIELSYPKSHTSVTLGNTISPSAASSPPVFVVSPLTTAARALSPTRTLASNKTYTLVLTDPDATSRADPVKAQMCHWIVTGITISAVNETEGLEESKAYTLEMGGAVHRQSTQETDSVLTNVEKLMKYLAPAPPEKTGKHRYVFVLLEPKEGKDGKLSTPGERPHWGYGKIGKGVREWAKENDLVHVGSNFFYSENEKQ